MQKLVPAAQNIAMIPLTVSLFGKNYGSVLELSTVEAVEYSGLKELFCGSLEDKMVKRISDIKDLFREVSEGS